MVDPELSRRRLALVAQAAERLLAADDPAGMVDELFALIEAELRLDVFFNYRLEGDRLVLEASGGLTEEQARAGAELALGQAVCGCAARDRKKLHVTGVQASNDPLVAFVRDVGLDAYACTPLLHGDTLIGTLGFGRRWADRFTEDELSFLHTLCHYVALAKYRLNLEQELRSGLEQRDRLLAELNHRVRNALQLAVSVVRLEAGAAAGQACSDVLARVSDRIEVIASAHRPLYTSEDFGAVRVSDLLTVAVGRDLGIAGSSDASLPIEQGVALALLVHSLLVEGSTGEETVSIQMVERTGTTWMDVNVAGCGCLSQTLEERLPRALLRQLGAEVVHGADALSLRFPVARND